MGRRRVRGRAEQQPADDDQPEHAVQPDLQHELVGAVHAAAAARLQDRRDAPAAAGHEDQPRHLRRPAAGDDHQHAVERPQRVLGLRVRRAVGGRRAAVGRPGRAAGARTTRRASRSARWRRSTSSRRSRRRRPRGRTSSRRRRRVRTDRARAEAAHRRRHRAIRTGTPRSIPIDRPDFRPEPVDIDGGGPPRAQRAHRPRHRARRTVEANDVTLKYLRRSDAAAGRFRRRRYGLVGVGGTQLITSRRPASTGSRHRHHSRRLRRRALARCSAATIRAGRSQLNFSYPLGVSAQEASAARARVQLNQVQAQLKQIELQVATDVTNAAITVQSNVERVQAAQAARELAQQTARRRTEQVRGRHVDELLRRPGAARSRRPRRTTSCRRSSTTASRWSSSSGCSRRRCRT